MADHYAALGLSRSASDEDVKRAYRRLARELHPDLNPGDKHAEERFKEVTHAYEVLSDPEKRRRYDLYGDSGPAGGDPFSGFGGAGGLGDLFDAFFGGAGSGGRSRPGGPPPGADLETALDLDFVEAVFGAERELPARVPVTCDTCTGTGAAPGTSPQTCTSCGGAGEVRRVRQSILGQMVTTSPCPRCGGVGQEILSPCPSCRGEGRVTQQRTYTVTVPPGVDDGATLRLSGKGAAGPRGGPPGDLYVHLRVRPHERFSRRGTELSCVLHVPMTAAALGASTVLETLDGPEEITITPGTQSGREIRLRGLGVPDVHRRDRRGDLVVTVAVDVPTDLTARQEELLRQLAAERGEQVDPPDTGILGKIRSAFK